MLCTDLTLVKDLGEHSYAEPLKCRCWTCEICLPIRRRQLKRMARDGRPNTFLTLTVNPEEGESPEERACALVDAWRRLRRAAMRRYGYPRLPFLAVFERTRAGEPHLHVLLRVRWLDQSWLSAEMKRMINAPIVDIRRVKGKRQAAAYVAKYVGKKPTHFEGTKRYWRSQDYLRPVRGQKPVMDAEQPVFRVVALNFFKYIRQLYDCGYNISNDGRQVRWDHSQPILGP